MADKIDKDQESKELEDDKEVDKKEEEDKDNPINIPEFFKNNKIAIISITIVILLAGGILYYLNGVLTSPLIYEGVRVEGINIGGKTRKDAINILKSKKELDIDNSEMVLKYGDSSYNIKIRDLGFRYDYEKAINDAYNIARTGKNFDRLKEIKALKKNNKDIKLESTYDKEKVENAIIPIKEDINLEKVEAKFNFNGGNPQITDEASGRKVNEEKLKEMIHNNIYKLEPIKIPVDTIKPVRTKAALQRINGVIGEFQTNFPNSIPGRKENIRISAQAIANRGVIMPGETVSFNQTTGDRSLANGYKPAVVIEEGDYTDGVGGGVCQTSTTLYNALLRADVSIVSRAPHSIPAKYVPYGQDAAVAYDYMDLKFRNDFDFPIYINSIYTGNSIIFRVYGDKNIKNYGVKIDSETIETIPSKVENVVDKNLAPGTKELVQSGRTGYRINTYKTIIKNGQAQERKLITKDYYKPKNTVYRVGPSK